MGSLSGSGRDSRLGVGEGLVGVRCKANPLGSPPVPPTYSGNRNPRRNTGIEGKLARNPQHLALPSLQGRTFPPVQSGLNSRKTADYQGKNRGPLQPFTRSTPLPRLRFVVIGGRGISREWACHTLGTVFVNIAYCSRGKENTEKAHREPGAVIN